MIRENQTTDFGLADCITPSGDVMFMVDMKLTEGATTESENAQARFYANLVAAAQTDTEEHLK